MTEQEFAQIAQMMTELWGGEWTPTMQARMWRDHYLQESYAVVLRAMQQLGESHRRRPVIATIKQVIRTLEPEAPPTSDGWTDAKRALVAETREIHASMDDWPADEVLSWRLEHPHDWREVLPDEATMRAEVAKIRAGKGPMAKDLADGLERLYWAMKRREEHARARRQKVPF